MKTNTQSVFFVGLKFLSVQYRAAILFFLIIVNPAIAFGKDLEPSAGSFFSSILCKAKVRISKEKSFRACIARCNEKTNQCWKKLNNDINYRDVDCSDESSCYGVCNSKYWNKTGQDYASCFPKIGDKELNSEKTSGTTKAMSKTPNQEQKAPTSTNDLITEALKSFQTQSGPETNADADKVAEDRHGDIPEIDNTRASLEKGYQARYLQESNSEMLEDVRRLDEKLSKPDVEVGPKEKSAIAENLIAMQRELNHRANVAPLDASGTPIMEGVQWNPNSPLKGILEDLPEFANSDRWGTFIHEDKEPPAQTRSTPKSAQEKILEFPETVVKGDPDSRREQLHNDSTRAADKLVGRTRPIESTTLEEAFEQDKNNPYKTPKEETPYGPKEGLKKLGEYAAKQVIRTIIKGEPSVLPNPVGATKDYGSQILGAIDSTVNVNTQNARIAGANYGLGELYLDGQHTDNPHVQSGQPYTDKELEDRIRARPSVDVDFERTFWRVEAGDKADEAYKEALHALTERVNQLLTEGRTPEERQVLIQEFVEATNQRIPRSSKPAR